MIIYEYPFNERIRTLLRLESLFARANFFVHSCAAFEHYAALLAFFEILDVIARTDLKKEFIRELERQKQNLMSFSNNPEISQSVLSETLTEIDSVLSDLISLNGRLGQDLRDNEWLMLVKSRANIPGGLCEFDMPSFHWWLHQDKERAQHVQNIFQHFQTPYRAVALILKLLRESENFESFTAEKGEFRLKNVRANTNLLRLGLDESEECVPEISANKYFLGLRFLPPAARHGICKISVAKNIPFQVAFCQL